jgi:hypothetical protein
MTPREKSGENIYGVRMLLTLRENSVIEGVLLGEFAADAERKFCHRRCALRRICS